jgi:hypothetical protein
MQRLGPTVLLIFCVAACDSDKSSTTPEPASTSGAVEQPQPEPEAEPEPEPEPEPVAEVAEPMEFKEASFSQDGFEARNFHCKLNAETKGAQGFIKAGLVDQDAALDACAPKGAAIEVTWSYISSAAQNVSVTATDAKQAKCITKAMGGVRAGVDATCSAVLLLGDLTAATAAFDAR